MKYVYYPNLNILLPTRIDKIEYLKWEDVVMCDQICNFLNRKFFSEGQVVQGCALLQFMVFSLFQSLENIAEKHADPIL